MWTRIKGRIRAWWAAEGALVQLQGVSDRMLADMGLERGELRARVVAPEAAAEAAHRGCAAAAPQPGRC